MIELEKIAVPNVAFDKRLDEPNVFSDVFGKLSNAEWEAVLKRSIKEPNIDGVDFPSFPPEEMQNRIHGHSAEVSLTEAAAFHQFACDHGIAGPASPAFGSGYMLDYGAGWGRILRPFMRDFPLKHIVGYEPSGVFCTVARGLNPYVGFLSGGYMPEGILPADRFNLAVGWSIYSHINEFMTTAWLKETARILVKGGAAMYTTWGMRFLERLRDEAIMFERGEDIHWYSQVCLRGAGDIDQRIEDYKEGKFVWFNSINNEYYGETFMSRVALERIIVSNELPLIVEVFDDVSLGQDVFILRRY
jgi:hypothetical protein